MSATSKLANYQLLNSSASAEWFTPPHYIKAVREVLGAIDLDPASCEAANRIVQAARYFTETDNGYTREWRGKLFLNPPYGWCYPDGRRKENGGLSAQGHWTKRLIAQYRAGTVTEAILLINANTGEQWFQALWEFPICFVNRRIRFIPGEGTDPHKQPTKSNAFIYFGPRPARFTEVFGQFGRVVTPEVLRGQVKRNTGEWFLPTHSNTRTPLTESAPAKASSSASEAKQDATFTKDVQTSPGVGDNDSASLPPGVSTPAKYTRRRGLANAGR
jgi:hypothetical protein